VPLAPFPFTLRQLQYVVAVADQRSFRGAAETCRVAQPSLSAQVAEVESQIGVQLFERGHGPVRPTEAGGAFVEHARAVLLGATALRDATQTLRDPFQRTLRIGVIPTVAPYLLPEVGPALRKKYPQLSLHWVEEKTAVLLQSLHHGDLDAVIVATGPETAALPKVVLGKDPFVFAAAPNHPLARRKKPIEAADLDGERVLLLDDGHCFRDQALSFCARHGAEEAGYRATSLQTLVQMAASGDAVTLLPNLALAVENRRETLVVRAFGPRGPSRTLALVWRRSSGATVTLEAVGEALQRAVRKFLH